jgi:hypothetical protein
MFAVELHNTFESSLSSAKRLAGLELILESFKLKLGKAIASFFLLLLCLPFVFLFGYWLQLKRRKFVQHMKKDVPSFKSASQYKDFKTSLEQLDSLVPSLKKVTNYNLQQIPFLFRYTLGQMKKMSSTLVTYNEWLHARLHSLNEDRFHSDSKVFRLVPEGELWKQRNQAYQYWM